MPYINFEVTPERLIEYRVAKAQLGCDSWVELLDYLLAKAQVEV
jgi:hypothetical protein